MAARTVIPNPVLPEDISPGLTAALEHAAALERVKAWPCGGVCSTLLWPAQGGEAFVCSAYNSDIDALCTRHWGHRGLHCECTPDTHALHVWPGRKAA